MQPIRILLVDDNPEFLNSAAHFLSTDPQIEIVGHALSGEDALEQVAQTQPDLVLMDLLMSDMNGLEATRRIKERPDAPRVVVLTLYDQPEYRAEAETARADGFITKSEFGDQLLPLIHTLLAEPATLTGDRNNERGEETGMRNVLVVDDSATMRRMEMASLRDLEDVSFDEASTGLEAIERLALRPIQLMILDLNMPDMHGLEVLRFVRRHNAYRDIPIIVLTTRGDATSRDAALAAGASIYLTKPFEPRMLAGHASELLAE